MDFPEYKKSDRSLDFPLYKSRSLDFPKYKKHRVSSSTLEKAGLGICSRRACKAGAKEEFCATRAQRVYLLRALAMEHFEKAIVAANVDIGRYTINPVVLAQTQTTAGRCLAKLSRTDDAVAAFEAAIEVAMRSQMPFFEMLAHRDYIVHVLDAQGKRDCQLAALGGCIARMKMEPSAYTPILGAGIDAEAAVAQFRATAAE